MRVDAQHQGRDCVIPEVSRNHNIGETGATVSAQHYSATLAQIAFAQVVFRFAHVSLLLRQNGVGKH